MIISSIGILLFSFPIPFTGNWYGFAILHMVLNGFIQIGYLTACVYVFEMLGPSKAGYSTTVFRLASKKFYSLSKRYLAIANSILFSLGYGSVSLWDCVFHYHESKMI